MIEYGKPASNQMQAQGLGADGDITMKQARAWIAENPDAWAFYKALAADESSNGNEASPNYVLQAMRHRKRVSVRNGFGPYFARIAMEEDPSIKLRIARSKADGFTEAVL